MRAASREWPPRSVKKSASTESDSGPSPNSSAHTARSRVSSEPSAGATGPEPIRRRPVGRGSRPRSTLPLGMVGRAATTSRNDGTM